MQEKVITFLALLGCITIMICMAASIAADRVRRAERAKYQEMKRHYENILYGRQVGIDLLKVTIAKQGSIVRNLGITKEKLQHKVGVLQARIKRLQKRGR